MAVARGVYFCGEKEMRDENVTRGSERVSGDVLYVSPYFVVYFSVFFASLRMFYIKKM